MSDILPKFKMYIFICVISFLMGLFVAIAKGVFSISDILGFSIGSFVPFVNLTMLINSGFPDSVNLFVGVILGVIGGIEVFLLAMFILQTVHNLIWNPDV